MIYPVPRLNKVDKKYPVTSARIWSHSAQAVEDLSNSIKCTCPYCGGHRHLGIYWTSAHASPYCTYECEHCDDDGMVTRPVWDLDDPNGGWDCCPVCFAGQNLGNEPCDVCQYWLGQYDIVLTPPSE